MHKQLNDIHDNDRERARSIIQNMFYDKKAMRLNPFFCKVDKDEKTLNLPTKLLYSMA